MRFLWENPLGFKIALKNNLVGSDIFHNIFLKMR